MRKISWFNLIGLGVFFLVLTSSIFILLRRAEYATLVLKVSESGSINNTYGAPMWYLDQLKPGFEQKDVFGRPRISILDSFSYVSNSKERVAYLTLKLLTTYDKKTEVYSYEGVSLLVGSYQSFKIKNIQLTGVIYRIENGNWEPQQKKYLVEGYINPAAIQNQDPYVAEVTTQGVKSYLADKITEGMEIKDSSGKIVAKIKKLKKQLSYSRFIYNDKLVSFLDPDRKKVEVTMELLTNKYGDVYLFENETPVRINENLNLNFWDFDLILTITDFQEI